MQLLDLVCPEVDSLQLGDAKNMVSQILQLCSAFPSNGALHLRAVQVPVPRVREASLLCVEL